MKIIFSLFLAFSTLNCYSQFYQPYFNSVDWSTDMYVNNSGKPPINAPKVSRAFDSSMQFHWYVKGMYFDTMRSNVSAMPTSVDRVMWQRMSDGRMMFSNASDWYNKVQVDNALSLKFNTNDTANKWLGAGYTPAWVSISGKPSFALVATTGNYNDLSNKPTIPAAQVNSDWAAVSGVSQILNKPTIPTNTNQLANGSGYIDQAGARSAISLTTNNTSGNATYNSSTGVLNIPNYTSVAPTITNSVSRTLNTNFTVSSTKYANVVYSVTCQATNPLLAGNSTASAFLEYSINSGSSWTTVSTQTITSSVALAVAVAITQAQTVPLSGWIPANALVRIRTSTTGTGVVTYNNGQETTF